MKRGELTTTQLITLIILIVSFVIILFLLFRLDLGKETAKEVCHNSVLTKGSSVLPSDAVSLNCHRSYICLTKDGSCEKMTNPEIKKIKEISDVYQVLADEMADCWWMFGEGKLDYIGSGLTKNNYCSICSQLAFDDSLESIEGIVGEINKDALYDFLSSEEISEGETYAEYLFGTNDLNELKKQAMEETGQQGIGTFGTIDLEKQYFVVMGITNEIGNIYKWLGGVGAVAGVVVGVTGGWTVGAVVIGISVATASGGEIVAESFEPEILALTVGGRGIDNQFMAPTIQEANSDNFDSLNCEDILTLT